MQCLCTTCFKSNVTGLNRQKDGNHGCLYMSVPDGCFHSAGCCQWLNGYKVGEKTLWSKWPAQEVPHLVQG